MFVPGPGEAFVKNVQIMEPSAMDEVTSAVDVCVQAIFTLHHGHAFAEISRIVPGRIVCSVPIQINVMIAAVMSSDSCKPFLKVAAPSK